ncbi:MAG TPA: hypothetical protein PKN32_00965 [Bacteroidales bacterium]|nr:hypothetical protein [Bacteroidales bacterium]
MKTKIIILAISVIAYASAYSQNFKVKNNKAYNIEETYDKIFINQSRLGFISAYGTFYPLNGTDKMLFEYGIDIGQYSKMLTKNRYLNIIVNATTITGHRFNNYKFKAYEGNGGIHSFSTNITSLSLFKMGLSISLFDLIPKDGYKSRINLIPYPGININFYCLPVSYNYFENPFTGSTKSFFSGFNNAGADISVRFNKVELSVGYVYRTYPDTQIGMPENMIASLEPDIPRGLFTLSTKIDVFIPFKDNVRVKHKIPKIAISKTKIFQDVKSLQALNPIGVFQVNSTIKPVDNEIDLKLTNIKVESPSDKIKILKSSYLYEKTKKEYLLSFDIQVNGLDPCDVNLPVKLYSDGEYLCTESIKLTINPDSTYIAEIKISDLAQLTPSFYGLCENIAGKVSNYSGFNNESSVLIYLPDESKLGYFTTQLVKMHLNAKYIVIAGTEEAEYIRPDYKIYCGYTNNENSNTMFLTLTVHNAKTGERFSPFQENVKYSEGIEKSYLKALSLYPGDPLLSKL